MAPLIAAAIADCWAAVAGVWTVADCAVADCAFADFSAPAVLAARVVGEVRKVVVFCAGEGSQIDSNIAKISGTNVPLNRYECCKKFMTNRLSEAYLQSQVQTASPLQLVHMAYEGAIQAIVEAREHLAGKRIRERCRAVTKAQLILAELQRSLDYQNGANVSVQLGRLYDYAVRQLIDGNFRQIDSPLADAQKILETLNDGWKQIAAQEARATSTAWQESEELAAARTSYCL